MESQTRSLVGGSSEALFQILCPPSCLDHGSEALITLQRNIDAASLTPARSGYSQRSSKSVSVLRGAAPPLLEEIALLAHSPERKSSREKDDALETTKKVGTPGITCRRSLNTSRSVASSRMR
mmetsp:Transcript_31929/g.44525  ORF Transcript_31929/g.44525 Transcript_31929/m.44525 type:complete len:123 (+) Transcript_31929:194-562(+)